MALRVRDHVLATTVLVAGAALALVFAAALGYVPASALPRAPERVVAAIPHANAAISVAALGTIAQGWRWVRRGAIRRHRAAMGTATALFVAFLALYLYRVVLEGPTEFAGPAAVEQFAYLPLLVVHVSLAVVCVPLVVYVLVLAATHDVAELPDTNHPRVGRVAATLWLVSFGLGVAVYLLLYVLY